MATYLPAAQKNAAIGAMFPHATATYLTWNSASPGITGANVISGFTPQSSGWTTPTTGKEHNSSAMTFATAPTCTIKFFSLWNNATRTTYKGGGPTTATVVVPAGAKVAVAIGAITAGVTG